MYGNQLNYSPYKRIYYKMSGKETDPIHIDSETEPQLEGGVDEGLQSLPLTILVKVQKYNGTSLPKCLITEDII